MDAGTRVTVNGKTGTVAPRTPGLNAESVKVLLDGKKRAGAYFTKDVKVQSLSERTGLTPLEEN
jgi:hypothetical protein